jgi:hypothetical protein
MVMVCAGKLGCRMLARCMFARSMFAGDGVVGMHAVRTCSAMIRQSGAVALHGSAARTGCRSVTAQSATRAVATTTTAARVSATATAAATTARVAASAARGDAR